MLDGIHQLDASAQVEQQDGVRRVAELLAHRRRNPSASWVPMRCGHIGPRQ